MQQNLSSVIASAFNSMAALLCQSQPGDTHKHTHELCLNKSNNPAGTEHKCW